MSNSDDDFKALLSQPLESDAFDRPPPLPEGSYVAQVGEFTFGKTPTEKKTPFVSFKIKLVEPLPDVNAEEIAAVVARKPLADFDLKHDLYITGESAWRLADFLKNHAKVPAGLSGAEGIQAAVGTSIVVVLKKVENKKKPGEYFTNIDQTAAIPEN